MDTEGNAAAQEYERKIPRTTRIQKEACERPVRDVKERKKETGEALNALLLAAYYGKRRGARRVIRK